MAFIMGAISAHFASVAALRSSRNLANKRSSRAEPNAFTRRLLVNATSQKPSDCVTSALPIL
jgi:hypothetical protein